MNDNLAESTSMANIPPDELGLVAQYSMFSMYLVALSDGVLDVREKEDIIFIVSRYFGDKSPTEILTIIEQTFAGFAEAGATIGADLFVESGKLSSNSKLFIMHSALRLALTDDDLDPREIKILGMIAGWMQLSVSDTGLWKQLFGEMAGYKLDV